MAALGPISGTYALAKVDSGLVAQLGKWSINPKTEASEVAHSATAQAMDRVPGNLDWEGNFMAYGDSPLVWPGQTFVFSGSMDAPGATYYGTIGYTGRAICDEITIKLDVEGGKEIGYDAKFSSAVRSGLAATDYLQPSLSLNLPKDNATNALYSAIGCGASLAICPSTAIAPSWFAPSYPTAPTLCDFTGYNPVTNTPAPTNGFLGDVRTMDINIKAANKAYNSSGTGGYTGRLTGPLDITVGISCYVDKALGFGALPPQRTVLGARLYTRTDLSRYWEFAWLIVNQLSNIEADRHSGNIIGTTLNMGFKATGISAAGLGWIKAPPSDPTASGCTQRWPS